MISIISNDNELIEKLRIADKVKQIEKKNICDSKGTLVVSDKIVDINTLISEKETEQKCYYLVSKDNNIIQSIDKSILIVKNIKIIPPERTTNQICDTILDVSDNNDDNNIYTFFGTDDKVGTTSICINTALVLAERNPDTKIIIIIPDGQDASGWLKNNEVINYLQYKEIFTKEMIEDGIHKLKNNLHIVIGEKSLVDTCNVEYMEKAITYLKNIYDVVLIDAGNISDMERSTTYISLTNSDNNILITTQQHKSYDKFIQGCTELFQPLNINFKFLVLNKYINQKVFTKKENIKEKYKMPVLSTLSFEEDYLSIDEEKETQAFMNRKYKKEITNVAQFIEKKRGIIKSITNKKRFLRI